MKKSAKYATVAMTGLLIATGLSLAETKGSARSTAIRKCNAVVLKQVPNTGGDSVSYQQQRAAVWKDCMVNAGQKP